MPFLLWCSKTSGILCLLIPVTFQPPCAFKTALKTPQQNNAATSDFKFHLLHVWCLCMYVLLDITGAWIDFVNLTWDMRRVLKCTLAYDRVWSSWGDPVRLAGCEKPITNWLAHQLVFCTAKVSCELQALVYDILPSTTAILRYAIGPRKLSANKQFFAVFKQWWVCYKQLRLYQTFVV